MLLSFKHKQKVFCNIKKIIKRRKKIYIREIIEYNSEHFTHFKQWQLIREWIIKAAKFISFFQGEGKIQNIGLIINTLVDRTSGIVSNVTLCSGITMT